MRDPVMEAFHRVSAAQERDHECECDCADKLRAENERLLDRNARLCAADLAQVEEGLRALARELAEALDLAHDDAAERHRYAALLERARAAGLLP